MRRPFGVIIERPLALVPVPRMATFAPELHVEGGNHPSCLGTT
jgi:hypothetical protein